MIKARRQRSHVTDKVFSIDQLINNYGAICIPRKRRWLVRFGVLFRQFLDSMDSNPKELGYYKYLLWLRNSPGMASRIMNNEKK